AQLGIRRAPFSQQQPFALRDAHGAGEVTKPTALTQKCAISAASAALVQEDCHRRPSVQAAGTSTICGSFLHFCRVNPGAALPLCRPASCCLRRGTSPYKLNL